MQTIAFDPRPGSAAGAGPSLTPLAFDLARNEFRDNASRVPLGLSTYAAAMLTLAALSQANVRA